MSDTVITVDRLAKRYRVGVAPERYVALRDVLSRRLARIGRRFRGGKADRASKTEEFWALRDVSFQVSRGECLGIIGRNGAGKSTLLKLLSRITEPTQGEIRLRGRVGSLLEVGTGFHPELTGRENVSLNGAILGMSRHEISRKFDEMVAFAEVERFLDTPVKYYSSGMYTRLAFAVAAHLEPEILIVDEVLAVGDAQFQKKCLGKMGEVARHGRTVLFVSHNMQAVQSLCTSVIRLQQGRVVGNGPTSEVVRQYLDCDAENITQRVWDDLDTAPQNEFIRLRAARVHPVGDASPPVIAVLDPVDLEFEYDVLRPGMRVNVSVHVHTQDGVCAFAVTSFKEEKWDGAPFPVGRFKSTCHIPGNLLNDARYRVSVMFVRDTSVALFQEAAVLEFEVEDASVGRGNWYGKWPGVIRPKFEWETQRLDT